jgi:glycosyltransferase involved in cell wall biosynthesis
MKVLVLHSELGVLRGGGENVTKNLFSAFSERGHHVAAAFVADRRGRYAVPLPATIEPIPLNGWWSRNLGDRLFGTLGLDTCDAGPLTGIRDRAQEAISWRAIRWHNRRFERRVRRCLARRLPEFDASFVHGDVHLAATVARRLPTVLRLPGPVSADSTPLLQQVHTVCANGDVLSKVRTFLGDHIVELPIGINGAVFRPGPEAVRSRLGWSPSDFVVGYVGRLVHLKGVDIFAAAMRSLLRTIPNLRVLVVGRGPAERALRSELGDAAGRVWIQPDIDHDGMAEWYRAMSVFVMPSRYENYSNAVLEAMACGVPAVLSGVGGNLLLARGGAASIFESGSVSSLVERLEALWQDPQGLQRLGRAGAEIVRESFSWTRSARQLEAIFASHLPQSAIR